jgi:hypothetical protein
MLIDTVERHLQEMPEANIDRVAISNYLAQTAIVTFYSEMEENVKAVIIKRLRASGDGRVSQFVDNAGSSILQRIKKSKIVEAASFFGPECKEYFSKEFSDSEITKYSNIIGDRHETAHGKGASVTFGEIKEVVSIAERLLLTLDKAIHLEK